MELIHNYYVEVNGLQVWPPTWAIVLTVATAFIFVLAVVVAVGVTLSSRVRK